MGKLTGINAYPELKEALRNELKNQAQGFIRTGYLLKVARDTDILRESGYLSVAEFAKGEYGLTKDTVSRYIAINDKYSEGGYSDRLAEEYRDYGIAKLQEMLTLPESVTDLLTPELSRRQLQDLKKEIREEEQVTELEVMMEEPVDGQQDMSLLEKMLYQYFHQNRYDYVELSGSLDGIRDLTLLSRHRRATEEILNTLAPSGHNILSARVPGVGKMLLSIQGADNTIGLLNVRNGEKERITWEVLIGELERMMTGHSGKDGWEALYGEAYGEGQEEDVPAESGKKQEVPQTEPEEKSEVAPMQPAEEKAEPEIVEEKAETEPAVQTEVIPEAGTELVAAVTKEVNQEHIEALKEIMMDDLEQLRENIDQEQWDLVQLVANNIAAYAEELGELEKCQEAASYIKEERTE